MRNGSVKGMILDLGVKERNRGYHEGKEQLRICFAEIGGKGRDVSGCWADCEWVEEASEVISSSRRGILVGGCGGGEVVGGR